MKTIKVRKLFVVVLVSLLSEAAFAGSLSLVGIGDNSEIAATNRTIGSKLNYGGGVMIDFPLAMRVGLETGALYFTRSWQDTTSGTNTLTSTVLHVPAKLMFHFHMLSLGVGGYYASDQGNLTASGTINGSIGHGLYGIQSYDYGLVGDVRLLFPLGPRFALRLDAQYWDGLANLSTVSGSTFQNRDFVGMVGFTFGFGGEGGRR